MPTVRMSTTPPEPPPHQPNPWMASALCREVGSDIFYAEAPEGITGNFLRAWTREANAQAKRICAICPVRRECLEYALDADERHGVWGGMTPGERKDEARRRTDRPATSHREACGTAWGYRQHVRVGETPCEGCRAAGNAARAAQRRAERRAKRVAA